MARSRQRADGTWSARIRYGQGQDEWFTLDIDPMLPADRRRVAAEDRRKRLQRMAKLLKDSGKIGVSRIILEQAAAERSDRAFRNIEITVEGFTPDADDESKKPRTFRQVAHLYTTGELHALYPDDVPFKGKASLDASTSALSVFLPVLGDKTFDQITLDDIDAAKRLIPQKSRGSTRRAYIRELRRVMNLAVEPLRLVEHVVAVKIPKKQMGEDRLFAFLYPDEERQLNSCQAIPFWRRWLYAWIFRNGSRITETLQATWDHANLETGQFHLDQAWTKKKRARFWILEPDVLRAMKLHYDRLDPKPQGGDLIFPGSKGQRIAHHSTIRKHLQADLVRAGLTRRELFTEAEGERALTTHDTRATFVTLARRRGWGDQRIMDHTGHIHPSQLAQYNRLVRAAEQLHLGWFADMDVVLGLSPELQPAQPARASGPRPGQAAPFAGKTGASPFSSAQEPTPPDTREGGNLPPETTTEARPAPPMESHGPAGISTVGQAVAQVSTGGDSGPDIVERALAFALEAATKAQRWDVVLEVTRELSERRRARTQPAVTSLDARRKRKNGEEP